MQRDENDPHVVVRRWGTLTTEVAPLVAPIHLLIRDAAATDPEMATSLRDSGPWIRTSRATARVAPLPCVHRGVVIRIKPSGPPLTSLIAAY